MKARTVGALAVLSCAVTLAAGCSSQGASNSTANSLASESVTSSDSGMGSQSDTTETATGASGANSSVGPDLKDIKIAYGSPGSTAEYEVTITKGLEAVAKKLSLNVTTYDNKDDGQVALTNAQLMVQSKPDVIVEYSLFTGVNEALGQTFTKSGIPCIAVNIAITGCPLINLSNKQSGIDAANIVAKAALAKGWSAKDTTVLAVQCATCGTEVNDAPRYFYVQAAKLMGLTTIDPNKIVETTTTLGDNLLQVDGGTARDTSYTNIKAALQSVPKDRHLLVFSPNDDLTLGAWRAIDEAGRNANTLIAGANGSPEGLAQLRSNPSWVAEGSLFLPEWGQYVLAMAVAVAEGATPPDLTPLPQFAMSKDDVDTYYPDGATDAVKLPPLQPDAQYLAKTGVLQAVGMVQDLN